MTYNEFIEDILNNRGRFNCSEEYHERHHITPKSIGGSDNEDNLIDLYAREHYTAHKLLAEENPQNEKLLFALWSMSFKSSTTEDRYILTPEEYEEAKKAFSKVQSEVKKELFANKENHPMYGKHHSEEAKRKMSEAKKGKPSCNRGKKLSEKQKKILNRSGTKWSKEQHEKMDGRYANGNSTCCVPIYCPELNETFWGLQEACDKYGFTKPNISKCLKGIRKHSGKHPVTGEKLSWQYLNK